MGGEVKISWAKIQLPPLAPHPQTTGMFSFCLRATAPKSCRLEPVLAFGCRWQECKDPMCEQLGQTSGFWPPWSPASHHTAVGGWTSERATGSTSVRRVTGAVPASWGGRERNRSPEAVFSRNKPAMDEGIYLPINLRFIQNSQEVSQELLSHWTCPRLKVL